MDKLQQKREEIMTTIMNLFSQTFREHAVLCGGMVLRLLECPRLTNDLDYTFIPYSSKKEIKESVIETLSKIPGADMSYTMNSKCLRVILSVDEVVVQVEAKVSKNCETEILTTSALAKLYGQTSSVVRVMSYSSSLSNKIAAWLERRLIRDLYDIHFFLNMGVKPDNEILLKRIKRPQYSKLVKNKPERLKTVDNLFEFIKSEVINISQKDINSELSGLLEQDELIGLDMKIKAAITGRL